MQNYKKELEIMKKNPIITDNVIKLSMPIKEYIKQGWTSDRKLAWEFRLIQREDDRLVLINNKNEELAVSKEPIDFDNIPNKIELKKEYL